VVCTEVGIQIFLIKLMIHAGIVLQGKLKSHRRYLPIRNPRLVPLQYNCQSCVLNIVARKMAVTDCIRFVYLSFRLCTTPIVVLVHFTIYTA